LSDVLTYDRSVLLYLVFFPYDTAGDQEEDLTASITSLTATPPTNTRRDPLIVGASIFVTLFLVALISVALVFAFPHHTQLWADILGSVSGVLGMIQYLPQIRYTWKAKDVKSLSITTLVAQAPGSFLFALSLGLRVGLEGWSTWIVYVITGSLQFVLLGMAFTFAHQRRQHSKDATPVISEDDEADERTALLGGESAAQNSPPQE
jgi:uncharacterized protein with PQ loop repeat